MECYGNKMKRFLKTDFWQMKHGIWYAITGLEYNGVKRFVFPRESRTMRLSSRMRSSGQVQGFLFYVEPDETKSHLFFHVHIFSLWIGVGVIYLGLLLIQIGIRRWVCFWLDHTMFLPSSRAPTIFGVDEMTWDTTIFGVNEMIGDTKQF